MKMYISGRISGLPLNQAKRNFRKAKKQVEMYGYDPVSPFDVSKTDDSKTWEDYMLNDIRALFNCDGIYMLKGWGKSRGARIEYAIAREMGIIVYFQ